MTTRPDRRPDRRLGGDRAIAIVMTALLLVPMLTFAAFAVDLAVWHARVTKLQSAADAAALAGTVWMPNLPKARSVATDTLSRNGIADGVSGVTVTIDEGPTPTSLRVTITDHSAVRSFSQLIGAAPTLVRTAQAEYYQPLPLGSPLNYFGGDASKTAIADTTTISVSWPSAYNSTSRPPIGPFGCNVGTLASQALGRWTNATTYSAGGFSGTTQCQWATLSSTTSSNPTTQIPTNVPCNRVQSPTSTMGRWNSGVLGALPLYSSSNRFSSGTGNRQCTWVTSGSQPPDASTRAPANAPCVVTGEQSAGSWNLVLGMPVFLPLALLAAAPCSWVAGVVTTVTQHPNPIAADRNPGFWAQVEGPGTVTAYGDAFSTRCTSALNCGNVQSAQWRSSGYWYVIQVPPAGTAPFTISVFDAAFRRGGSITADTGDYNLGAASTTTNPDFATEYRVYRQTNPLDVTQRVPVGNGQVANTTDNSCWWSMTEDPTFDLQWRPLCTISPQLGDRYLLNVTSSDTGAVHGAGLNGYALQAVAASGAQPALYAYSDMGMFNNGSGTFYLAEVDPTFAGKVLDVDLWDPGDVSSGTATISPQMPSATVPKPVVPAPATCTYTSGPDPNSVNVTGGPWGSTGSVYTTAQASDSAQQCLVITASSVISQRFNDEWLHLRIQIPSNYTCTPGLNPETTAGSCWWGITYAFSSQPFDVTTWKASIEGDPVHLDP
jgi:hypothetical protein